MSLAKLADFEERLRRRQRIWSIPLQRMRDRSNPIEVYNCVQFKQRFHMDKETAIFITNLIQDKIRYPLLRGSQLPPIIQFLVGARFFATGSFQIIVGDVNNLSQGAVSKIVKRVAIAIAGLSKRFIKYPTLETAPLIRKKFYEIAQFPGIVGTIDCTHVKIESPGGESAELFRNRKGYFSINVQAISDSDLNFLNVVARWYGSAHDSRIFENSHVGMDLADGRVPGNLLGDAGYASQTYLFTPLANPITAAEKRYNRSQITTRNTVERSFGILKRRFRCLHHLRLKLNTSLTVIVATFVLHNITRKRLDIFEDDYYEPLMDECENLAQNDSLTGRTARLAIIESHFSGRS